MNLRYLTCRYVLSCIDYLGPLNFVKGAILVGPALNLRYMREGRVGVPGSFASDLMQAKIMEFHEV